MKKSTDGSMLKGAKYKIWNNNGYNQEFTTNEQGKIIVDGLKLGKYNYQEISAPTGYLLDNTIYSFELNYKDQNTSVVYANAERVNETPTGTFTLTKTNEEKTETLEGAKYRVWNDNGYNKEFITDKDGKIAIDGLELGKYYYKEIQAPYDYLLDDKIYSFELVYKDQNTKVVYISEERTNDKPTGTFILVKTNADESAVIEGTKYRIWNDIGYNKSFTTNNKGKIIVEELELGKYYYKEVQASDGYILDDTTHSFELNYKDQYTGIIYAETSKTNKEPTGTIEIIKRDSETDKIAQGNATFLNAKYEVYAEDDIYNKAKTKKIYSKGQVVATRIMKEDGTTDIIDNLPLGRYIVKEIASSDGYLLDKTEHKVNLEYANQNVEIVSESVTSYEIVKKMQVHIFKSGIKEQSGEVKGLQDAEFTIKLYSDVEKAINAGYTYEEIWNGIDKDGNKVEIDTVRILEAQTIAPNYDVITTDENGNAYTINLPYGKYIGKETKTPNDFYTASDFTFSITKDESEIEEIAQKVKHIVVNNEQMESYVKLIKKDVKTDKIVTLYSTTFKIRATEDIVDRGNGKVIYEKGDIITQKLGDIVYDTFTTNADNVVIPTNSYHTEFDDKGTVITPLTLPVGSFEVFEVEMPKGFLQLENSVTFEIENIRDYDKDGQGDYIKIIEIKNEQPTCIIFIDKEIVIRDNADTSLIDGSDLSGIEFTLITKEDVIDMADGSIIFEKGAEVQKVNLAKDRTAQITGLPIGSYELYESKTINGLVLNEKRYEVLFTQKDTVTKVYKENLKIENETTLVEFSKRSITGEDELIGAKLTVLDENNSVIDTWISALETHKIEGLIAGKTYTLREEISPEGFVKATDIQFTVNNTNEVQKVTMIDKVVEIVKTDLITGENIQGAILKVIDEDGNVIDSWTSTKEPHIVSGLEENKTYQLVELASPNGFEIAEEIEFVVTSDKTTQRIEMKDKPILQTIKLVKRDSKTNEIIKDSFTFGIYEDEQCTKLIKSVDADSKEGTIAFEDLRYGIYFIKEEKSPKSYILSEQIIKVEINEQGVFIDNEKIEGENMVYTFDFYNIPIDTPNTGDNSNLTQSAYLLIVSLILLVCMGVHEYKRRNLTSKNRK